MVFCLLHALVLARAGQIELGSVITYFSALSMLGFPTNTSIRSYSMISSGLAGARRLLHVMNAENNLDENVDGHQKRINGKVEFRNVDFAYDEKNLNLENLSFTVEAGQTVAIVGQTGSGKTSLIRLINRTYDPLDGQVFIDSLDLRDWKLDSLRSQISIIEQDIFLFSKTVAEKYRFWQQMPACMISNSHHKMLILTNLSTNSKSVTILSLVNAVQPFQAGSANVWLWHARF